MNTAVDKSMDKIDENTLLYLTCDDLLDTSNIKNKMLITGSPVFSDDAKKDKSFDFETSWNIRTVDNDIFKFPKGTDYTIDFWMKATNNDNWQYLISSNKGYRDLCICLKNSMLYFYSGTDGRFSSDVTIELDKWIHIACVRKGHTISVYVNGKLKNSRSDNTVDINMTSVNIGYRLGEENYRYYGKLDNIRISKGALWTDNFNPGTGGPIHPVIVNSTTNNSINLSIQGNNEDIKKVEVKLNKILSKTYIEESYLNLDYKIDESICVVGDNEIEIIVYDKTDSFVEHIAFRYIPDNLTKKSDIVDISSRMILIDRTRDYEYNLLKQILISKNIKVTDSDRFCDIINKVNRLSKLNIATYLYKDGDQCLDVTGGWVNE